MKFKISLFNKEFIFIAQNKSKANINVVPNEVKNRSYDKIFCIGLGKTGTTSTEKALTNFGFKMGNQLVGELIAFDWVYNNPNRIINFCRSADAFQDLPFGLPGLYKVLDKNFPNSKFILTVRDDENQWFNSLVKFHTKIYSKDKSAPPTEEDLLSADYIYPGYALDSKKAFGNYPEVKLYDEDYSKKRYIEHNKEVIEYFKNRKGDLLVLNVAEDKSYQKLAKFLNISVPADATFPWLNKT